MQMAGHQVIAALDFSERALAVHAANLTAINTRSKLGGARLSRVGPDAPWKGGIRRANLGDILAAAADVAGLNPDVIVGGPPCLPWSRAGSKPGDDDDRADLTVAFSVFVAAARPRYFVMENVQEIRRSGMLRQLRHILGRAGYGLTEMVINASHYGSAQNRDRFFCVGALNEIDGWFHDFMAEDKSARKTTVADILPDFGVELRRKGAKWRTNEATGNIDGRISQEGSGYRLRAADLRVLKKAGNSLRGYFRYPGGKSSACIRRTDEPMPTIIKSSGDGPGIYAPHRGDPVDLALLPIASLDELSQITGFPAGWKWEVPVDRPTGPDLSPIKMLANSVPPPLAAAIGRGLSRHVSKNRPAVKRPEWQAPKAFVEWLSRTSKLGASDQAMLISDLCKAKHYVAGYKLPSTRAEVAAFSKISAVNRELLSESHRESCISALSRFATWQELSRLLPSDREIRKLMKTKPYLRKHPAPLRANLAALELDQEFRALSGELRKEYRKTVIGNFRRGHPAPFYTSFIAEYPPVDSPEEDVPCSIRLSTSSSLQRDASIGLNGVEAVGAPTASPP
jgi:site-specific DNA-cytosine methylase